MDINVAVSCRLPNGPTREHHGRGGKWPIRSDERRRNGINLSDTYDDNFNCDERDNDELHASAGRLGENGCHSLAKCCRGESSPHGEVVEAQIAPQPHRLSCRLLRGSGP
jgi:hypothetical protein